MRSRFLMLYVLISLLSIATHTMDESTNPLPEDISVPSVQAQKPNKTTSMPEPKTDQEQEDDQEDENVQSDEESMTEAPARPDYTSLLLEIKKELGEVKNMIQELIEFNRPNYIVEDEGQEQ